MKLVIVYVGQKDAHYGLAVEQIEMNGLVFNGDAGWLQSTKNPFSVGDKIAFPKTLTLVEKDGFAKWAL